MRYSKAGFAGVVLVVLAGCVVEPTIDYEAQQFDRGAAIVADCMAVQCDRLDLDSARLTDFSVLNEMPHVTALMVSYSNFDDLGDIAEMSQLRELHIGGTAVTDLSGLAGFGNLELLHVQNMYEAPDLAPVYALTGLTELAVDVTNADGIGYVADMRGLERLMLMSGQINDLTPLSGHPSLRDLSIQAGTPEDDSALLDIRGLERLEMNWGELDEETLRVLDGRGVIYEEIALIVC